MCASRLFLSSTSSFHLLYEIPVNVGALLQFLYCGALAQGFIHLELAFACGNAGQFDQLFPGHLVEVFGEAQPVPSAFQRPYGFEKSLLVCFPDAHDLADGAHLRTQPVLNPFEFFKGPACELDHDIVSGRRVLVQSAVAPIGNFIQGQPGGEHGGHHRDGEAGGLERARSSAGAQVDFDDHDAVGNRVMGELDVGAADDFDGLHNGVGIALQTLLQFDRHGQHGGRAIGIARMHPHGVHVLDKADRDNLVLRIAYNFEFQLFPSQHGFFDEHLAHHTGGQSARGHRAQLLLVEHQSTARAAHRVGRPQYHRVAQFRGDGLGFLDAVRQFTARHFNADFVHCLLERFTVFPAFYGVQLDADDLDVIFVQNPGLGQLRGKIQAALASKIWKQRIRPLLIDNLGKGFNVEGLHIGGIGHDGVGHDGRRIGIYQQCLIAQCAQRFACLGAGVIKFACLANNNRAGTNNHNFVDIFSAGHTMVPPGCLNLKREVQPDSYGTLLAYRLVHRAYLTGIRAWISSF